MKEQNIQPRNGFTFDTCVGIKLCENPNFADMLELRMPLRNSKVHLCSQASLEATRLGYDVDLIAKKIRKMGAEVDIVHVNCEMKRTARELESRLPKLHAGDSRILVYAGRSQTVLVTCDRNLAYSAESLDMPVVNPDLLACDNVISRGPKIFAVVKKVIKKQARETKAKARNFTLKPGHTIAWNAFN